MVAEACAGGAGERRMRAALDALRCRRAAARMACGGDGSGRRRVERAAATWNGRRRCVAAALERRVERRRRGVGKSKRSDAGVHGQDT